MFSEAFKQKVKEQGVLKIASQYTRLKKTGANTWMGLCPNPDHEDKNPSFVVKMNPNDMESWYCNGCHRGPHESEEYFGSDNIAFVQWLYYHKKKTRLSFVDAVKILCKFYHLEIEEDKYESLYQQNEALCRHYQASMTQEARFYLEYRGLDDSDIQKWRLGYTGSRISFPIFNKSGRITGFSNRAFGKNAEYEAKYINSKTSPIFNKSQLFYGINFVQDADRRLIIVEGQMDAILAQKYGLINTVATMTCHLSPYHIQYIKEHKYEPILCYDGDAAGGKGLAIALSNLYEAGVHNSKVLILPKDIDMADLALQVKQGLPNYVHTNIKTYSQYVLGNLADELDSKMNAELQNMMPRITETLAGIADPDEKQIAKNYIEKRLRLWVA